MSGIKRRHRCNGATLFVLALLTAAAGCGRFQAPPVELSFRDSLVGAGKILQIENTTNEPLTGVEVTVAAPSGESRSFRQERLDGYQTVEVGWKKLGGWQIPLGAEIAIDADGYLLSFKGQLPEEGTNR